MQTKAAENRGPRRVLWLLRPVSISTQNSSKRRRQFRSCRFSVSSPHPRFDSPQSGAAQVLVPSFVIPTEGLISGEVEQPRSWLKIRIGGHRKSLVIPGADLLADVAAGHPGPQVIADRLR